MSPFGKNYQWRNTMYSLWHYLARRMLGAVAKVLDRMDRRERERREQLRAHPTGGHR